MAEHLGNMDYEVERRTDFGTCQSLAEVMQKIQVMEQNGLVLKGSGQEYSGMQLGQIVKSAIRMVNQNQSEKDPVLWDEQLRLAGVTSAGSLRSALVGIICQPKMAPPPPFYNNPSQNVQRLDRPVTATPVQPTPNSFVSQPSLQPAYPQPPYQQQPIPSQPVYQPAPAPYPFPRQPIPSEPPVVITSVRDSTEADVTRGTDLKERLEKMDPQKVLSGEFDLNDKKNQKGNFFTRLFSSKS